MAESRVVNIKYAAEPTAAKFHASDAFVRGLRGPIGTGKSVACAVDLFNLSLLQEPYKGVRKVRIGAIRNTYPELKSTTIKTWLDWFGEITSMKWDAPITGTVRLPLPDGTHLHLEIIFIAIDRPDDIKKLKSLDLTTCWLNEVSELAKAIYDMAVGRIARYPSMKDDGIGATHPCLVMDLNPCDDDHWYYKLAEERDEAAIEELEKTLKEVAGFDRPLLDFYALPRAVLRVGKGEKARYVPNPDAEGVRHQVLGYAYWLNQVAGKGEEWINVYLMGEYGTVTSGKPVFPEYRDSIHCSKTIIKPYVGLPLLLGWDFGLTPACAIGQVTPRGKLVLLDEIIGEDIGIREFAKNVAKPYLLTNYRGFEILSWSDPSGTSRSTITAEDTCIRELNEAGIPTNPAWTNEWNARREAVAGFMSRMPGGEPGLEVSPKCKTLRKGFNGKYFYERLAVLGEERFKDSPVKNMYSHIQDAAQAIALHADRDLQKDADRARRNAKRTASGQTSQKGQHAGAYA